MDSYPASLLDAAQCIRDGSLTSETLVRTALDRADQLSYLGCYIARFDEQALAAASRADAELAAGQDRGPLHGIPVGIKDVLATREAPTTAQSVASDPDWGHGQDAPVVARLREAGAIIMGKTTTMEYALGFPDADGPFPVPRNPWNTATWAGGSSSGCGNGVAAGLFSAGIGTDTGGSIRVPSAFCGVTGLMPTFGTVPMAGCLPLSFSMDRIGPMARTARDCAALLDVMAGAGGSADRPAEPAVSPHPAHAGSLSGVVIGVYRPGSPAGTDPALAGCVDAALALLAALGATTTEVDLPQYDEVQEINWMTVVCEAAAYHRMRLAARWLEYGRSTRLMIAEGLLIGAPDYVQAQRIRRTVQRSLRLLFSEVDLVAMPTASTVAPDLETLHAGDPADILTGLNTSYWNPVGNPVLALPIGFSDSGLPLSLQLAAAPYQEHLALAVGALYQEATDWHSRTPAPSVPVAGHARPGSPPGPGWGSAHQEGHDERAASLPGTADEVRRVLAAAGLPASGDELRRLSARALIVAEMRDRLQSATRSGEESPALVFEAMPGPAPW